MTESIVIHQSFRVLRESLGLETRVTKKLPRGAKILRANKNRKGINIWFLAPAQAKESKLDARTFAIVCTGEDVPLGPKQSAEYVGTWEEDDGAYVFHVFEIVGPAA